MSPLVVLNYQPLKYKKIVDEIETLARKYQRYDFYAVDSILDPSAFRNFIPQLAKHKTGYRFFFENKAVS